MAERPVTALNPAELLAHQTRVLERFSGEQVLTEPPRDAIEFIERSKEAGFTFQLYLEPTAVLSQDSNYPGWTVRFGSWLYEQISQGRVSPDAIRLSPGWRAMEAIQKPNHDGGNQLYESDALAPILEKLRSSGHIAVPDHCKHIPSISRFGVSPKEIIGPVVAVSSELLRVKPENRLDLPSVASWSFRGNTEHPEWSKTTTWEWFENKFGSDYRLIGGRSAGGGGLGNVDYGWSGSHVGGVGFRLSASFLSSKP